MKKRAAILGTQEFQIMKVVWDQGRVTVRDVYETLLARRRVAYTTVMTMMNILEQKGFLRKMPGADRAYLYESAKSRKSVMRTMVKEFLDRVFGGSASPLMVHLIEDRHLTEDDLDELRKSIRRKGGSA